MPLKSIFKISGPNYNVMLLDLRSTVHTRFNPAGMKKIYNYFNFRYK